MNLNSKILDEIHAAGSQVVAVTKYLDSSELRLVQADLLKHPAVYGLGENRAEDLEAKNLPRDQVHFIGRLQSRRLPQIVHHCAVIHSLDNLSHAEKIQKACDSHDLLIKIFVQMNVSKEEQKGGIEPEKLPEFLKKVATLKNCEVVGLSAMGSGEVSEFELLKKLRDEYLPNGLISAGTSRDYETALECGVDIVRIGRALF